MKANELMIGDWVNIYVFPNESPKKKDLFPAIITTIMTPLPNEQGGEHIECIFKSEDGGIGCATRPVNTCLPIPLTPEILEKNFEKKTFYGIYDDYFDLDIREYSDGLYIVTYHSCEFNIPDQTIHLSWVHELQHFMRHCGIDKTIEL